MLKMPETAARSTQTLVEIHNKGEDTHKMQNEQRRRSKKHSKKSFNVLP